MIKKAQILQPPKGFRDFLPEEAAKRRYLMDKIIRVFEVYGYDPLETPSLEYASVLEGKYGEEERLIFKFEDRGGRELALRFDQTVPLARVIAHYGSQLPIPFKRYQIQPAWRAEKPQAGRYREFVQCDFDIVGPRSPLADAETIAVVNSVMQNLGFEKYLILYNDRRILSRIIKESGIKKQLEIPITRILDKLEKIGEEEVVKELKIIGITESEVEILMSLLGRRPLLPGKSKPEVSLSEIDAVIAYLNDFGVPQNKVLYSPTLARGFDYYTGIIIEVSVEGYSGGSVAGGGRYDNLIGIFSKTPIPAVGVSFGFDRLFEAMDQCKLFPTTRSKTKVLVTIFKEELTNNSLSLSTKLRESGIPTEIYFDPSAKLSKQIRYADKKGIEFIIILGPEELENANVTVKNIKTGFQETIPLEKLSAHLRS